MLKIGLIVNPVAGLGGKVGLKGSDGKEIQEKALALGASPEAPNRAAEALRTLVASATTLPELLVAPAEMGADSATAANIPFQVVGEITSHATTAADTIAIARQMRDLGVDLIVFAGGDGTARNVCEAVADTVPVLGIPAGVKIHSAVYAIHPRAAGKALTSFVEGRSSNFREAEVMDIDEDAFRQGVVKTRLYGYMRTLLLTEYMQNVKSGGYSEASEVSGIASEIVSNMKDDVFYIIGPGTTTRAVMEALSLPSTLLGMDVVKNKQLVASDLNEKELWQLLQGQPVELVLTIIGGQGHVFGRGNQQLSPRIIRLVGKEHIKIIASRSKLTSISPSPMLCDSGDPALDQELSGWYRVTTGFEDSVMYRMEC